VTDADPDTGGGVVVVWILHVARTGEESWWKKPDVPGE
jgi:hypothetical protein